MSTPLQWLCVLWGSHRAFRLYRWFLSLPLIISGENNTVYRMYITGYTSTFSHMKSTYSVAFFNSRDKTDICTLIALVFHKVILKKSRRSYRWEVSCTEPRLFLILLVQGNVPSLFHNREVRTWRYSREKVRQNWGKFWYNLLKYLDSWLLYELECTAELQ